MTKIMLVKISEELDTMIKIYSAKCQLKQYEAIPLLLNMGLRYEEERTKSIKKRLKKK